MFPSTSLKKAIGNSRCWDFGSSVLIAMGISCKAEIVVPDTISIDIHLQNHVILQNYLLLFIWRVQWVIIRIDIVLMLSWEGKREREKEREYDAQSGGDRRVEVLKKVCKSRNGSECLLIFCRCSFYNIFSVGIYRVTLLFLLGFRTQLPL